MPLSPSIASVIEEQLHVCSYRNARMHMCTCTTISEPKLPCHFVGNRQVGVGHGYVRRSRLGFLRCTAYLDNAV